MTTVRMGNRSPRPETGITHDDPVEYTWNDRGAGYTHQAEGRPHGKDALIHVLSNDVTHLPDQECFVSIVTEWRAHSRTAPEYVWSDDDDLALMISETYGCPIGRPDDVEDTHYTAAGPPGVGPTQPAPEPDTGGGVSGGRGVRRRNRLAWLNPFAAKPAWALRTNGGRDGQAIQMGGGANVPSAGRTSVGTPTATTLPDSGASFPTSGDSLAYRTVIAGSGSTAVEGVIISNTGTALTVHRWRTPSNPTGANASTPGTNTAYVITGAVAPWAFVGISANASPSSSDTALTGEIVTSGGGLIRKAAPYGHSASATTYTMTPVFTANGSDSLPVTIASLGVFQDLPSTPTTAAGQPIFTTALSATATLTAIGDQLSITETVTTA